MPAPTEPTNTDKVMSALEYTLNQINNANGYRTNGIVVVRGGDPTNYIKDFDAEYKEKMAAINIAPGYEEYVGMIGKTMRYKYTYAMYCMRTLSDDDRSGSSLVSSKTLDVLQAEMVKDVKRAIRNDIEFSAAGVALGYTLNGSGKYTSILHHNVIAVRSDEGISWPHVMFQLLAEFEFSEDPSNP